MLRSFRRDGSRGRFWLCMLAAVCLAISGSMGMTAQAAPTQDTDRSDAKLLEAGEARLAEDDTSAQESGGTRTAGNGAPEKEKTDETVLSVGEAAIGSSVREKLSDTGSTAESAGEDNAQGGSRSGASDAADGTKKDGTDESGADEDGTEEPTGAEKEDALLESDPAEDGAGSLVMTNVTNTLNVREEPDEEAQKVGYLYADCGGTVLERKDGWTKLESGHLTGWAKDEYLIFGEKALEEAVEVGRTVARVTGETLRIRKEPSMEAAVYDLAAKGELFEVINEEQLEFSDGIRIGVEWAAIDYEGRTGYVSSEYIEVEFEYDTGETLEEIAAREAEAKRTESAKNQKASASSQSQPPQKVNAGAIPAGTSDAMLLAALIQCEAGSEIYEGQVAVGAVVVNRVKSGSYPNTVSGVIFASGQFTPAGSGAVARLLENGNVKASCIQAANEALAGATNVGSATHFRRAGSREGIVIGNHVFW